MRIKPIISLHRIRMVFYTYLVMDIFLQKNVDFLKQLHQVLKNQTSCEVQYFHSGDLDYGGNQNFSVYTQNNLSGVRAASDGC